MHYEHKYLIVLSMSQKFRITQNFVKNEPKTAENNIVRNI